MLDVNTLPKVIESWRIWKLSKVHVSWGGVEKERKKEELIFKTNALVPKTAVIRKEEGATVAASPTFSQRAASSDRQRSSMEESKPSGISH